MSVCDVCVIVCLTLQRVSCQAQLADDVARDVGLHQVSFFSVIFGRFQQMIKLLRVELLHTSVSHTHQSLLLSVTTMILESCYVVWNYTVPFL